MRPTAADALGRGSNEFKRRALRHGPRSAPSIPDRFRHEWPASNNCSGRVCGPGAPGVAQRGAPPARGGFGRAGAGQSGRIGRLDKVARFFRLSSGEAGSPAPVASHDSFRSIAARTIVAAQLRSSGEPSAAMRISARPTSPMEAASAADLGDQIGTINGLSTPMIAYRRKPQRGQVTMMQSQRIRPTRHGRAGQGMRPAKPAITDQL